MAPQSGESRWFIPTVRRFARLDLAMTAKYGFRPSFNQLFAVDDSPTGWWFTPYYFGIDHVQRR
jgi:hypothetical protein